MWRDVLDIGITILLLLLPLWMGLLAVVIVMIAEKIEGLVPEPPIRHIDHGDHRARGQISMADF